MPRFLDAHRLMGLDEEALRNLQNAPPDEFGIKAVNLMYNQEEDKFYFLTDGPNKEAIQKHHNKRGFNCEWITEVKTTA
ncbi:MAG TPA: nickel-binding protein [Nitrososphaeraceae archaeon]|nr:nickel-binding protein [Nitrososphaeraceae archaeon]